MRDKKLSAYRAKRDFSRTRERSGDAEPEAGGRLRVVIQEHGATHLHYDLELELDGVFKSKTKARSGYCNAETPLADAIKRLSA